MRLLGCSDYRGLACILLSSSGLAVLLALVFDFNYWVSLSLYLAALAAPIYIADRPRSIIWTLVSLASLALFLYDQGLWLLTSLLSLLGVAVLASSDIRASLIGLGAPIALSIHFSPQDYQWNLLSVYALLLGLAAVMITGRIHSAVVSLAALIPLISPGAPSLAAVMIELLIVVAAADLVRVSGCPFRTDPRLLYAGALLGVPTTLALMLVDSIYAKALWATGYLILLSSALSPATLSIKMGST